MRARAQADNSEQLDPNTRNRFCLLDTGCWQVVGARVTRPPMHKSVTCVAHPEDHVIKVVNFNAATIWIRLCRLENFVQSKRELCHRLNFVLRVKLLV